MDPSALRRMETIVCNRVQENVNRLNNGEDLTVAVDGETKTINHSDVNLVKEVVFQQSVVYENGFPILGRSLFSLGYRCVTIHAEGGRGQFIFTDKGYSFLQAEADIITWLALDRVKHFFEQFNCPFSWKLDISVLCSIVSVSETKTVVLCQSHALIPKSEFCISMNDVTMDEHYNQFIGSSQLQHGSEDVSSCIFENTGLVYCKHLKDCKIRNIGPGGGTFIDMSNVEMSGTLKSNSK